MVHEHKGQGLREHRAPSVHDHAAALVLEGGQACRAAAAAPPGIDLPAAAQPMLLTGRAAQQAPAPHRQT